MPQTWIAPQQNNLLETFAQAQQIQGQRSQNALYEAKAAELPFERERKQALNAANISKSEAEARKAESDTQGSDLANTLKRVELGAQLFSGVRDEGSYQWAKKRAAALKLPVDHLPESYDPAFVERTLQSGMKIKDQLTQKLNEQKFGLDVLDTQSKIGRREVQNRYSESMMGKPMVIQTPGGAFSYDPQNPEGTATRMDTGPSSAEVAEAKRNQPKPETVAKIRDKLQSIALIRQQLENIKGKFKGIQNSYSAGPGADYLPTPGGQAFDASVAAMSPFIRQLTRTPGEGAMSDYESKLVADGLPSRGKYEDVTAQQIQQWEDTVSQLESGYRGMLEGQGGPAPQAGASGSWGATPPPPVMEPGADAGGTREQFIEEARRRGLVP